MAYSKGTAVQSATASTVTSLTCAPTYLAHDVAWVVVTYGTGSAIAETVTDGTNTYTKLGSTIADAANSQCMAQFYCKDCAAGTPTVSFNLASSSSYLGMLVLPIRGLDNTATPVGGGQLQSGPGNGTNAITSGNITPPSQPAFFGGFVLNTSDFTTTFVAGTPGFADNGGLSTWTGIGLPPNAYEDVRIVSTAAKAATFTASSGAGQNIALAFTFPEPAAIVPVGSRSRKNTIHPGRHPDRFGRHIRTRRYNTQTAPAAATGTASIANGNDTSSASGTIVVSGTAAITDANDTVAASGSVPIPQGSRRARTPVHPGRGPYNFTRFKRPTRSVYQPPSVITGVAAFTNAGDTSSVVAFTVVKGSAAPSDANDTSSISGSPAVGGSSAITDANDTAAGSGYLGVAGTASVANANDTATASGSPKVTGTVADADTFDTMSASGAPVVRGTSAIVNGSDTSTSSTGVGGNSANQSIHVGVGVGI